MEKLLSTADLVRELYRRDLIIGETALRAYEGAGLIPPARRLGCQRVWRTDDIDDIEAGVRARRPAIAARRVAERSFP